MQKRSAIGKGLRALIDIVRGSPATPDPDSNIYVPESLRYELNVLHATSSVRHDVQETLDPSAQPVIGGLLSKEMIDRQLDHPGFRPGLNVYLGMKLLNAEPERQRALLEDVTGAVIECGNQEAPLADVMRPHLRNIPDNARVIATKIFQIFRYGPHWSAQRIGALARDSFDERRAPALIAYAALAGYPRFVQTMREQYERFRMLLLLPKNINDPVAAHGFDISVAGNACCVSNVGAETDLPELYKERSMILMDDTSKTLTTFCGVMTALRHRQQPVRVHSIRHAFTTPADGNRF